MRYRSCADRCKGCINGDAEERNQGQSGKSREQCKADVLVLLHDWLLIC